MSEIRELLRGRGVRAGLAALVAAGGIASAGVAGAAEDADVTILAQGEGEGRWVEPNHTIQTGDTVTWGFATTRTHNVASTNTNDNDPRWEGFAYKGDFQPVTDDSSTQFTFYKAGTYTYVCQFHQVSMQGTITVEGADQELPEPTATPSPTVTASPTPAPTLPSPPPPATPAPPPDTHTATPPPARGADATKPAITSVRARATQVRFRLSEPATVVIQVRKRGAKRALRTVRAQVAAGTRTVRLGGRRLRRGRYTVTLAARDAFGNRSTAARARLRVPR